MKQKLVGNDKIGNLIRVNRQILEPGHKGYASIVFWGDLHYGHPQCLTEKAQAMLNYCLEHHIYIIGMGDFLECGTRLSIGDSVYRQKLDPQGQMEFVLEMLKPLANAKLLLGIHTGNHESRISDMGGLDVVKNMARELSVPYLGAACWHYIRVGKEGYTLYTMHGSTGSRFKHTKLKAVADIANFVEPDLVAMGHVHEIAIEPMFRQHYDSRAKTVKERKIMLVLTGAYLAYDKSYAQTKGYPLAGIGSPKVQFYGDRWNVHGSI